MYMEYRLYSFYINVTKKLNIGQVQKGRISTVFQPAETCGSVVRYESATVSVVRSLALDSSPGIWNIYCFYIDVSKKLNIVHVQKGRINMYFSQ